MAYWSYRVIEFDQKPNQVERRWREIREVFYREDGTPEFYGRAATVRWDASDTEDDPHEIIEKMKMALVAPVLVEKDFSGREVSDKALLDLMAVLDRSTDENARDSLVQSLFSTGFALDSHEKYVQALDVIIKADDMSLVDGSVESRLVQVLLDEVEAFACRDSEQPA